MITKSTSCLAVLLAAAVASASCASGESATDAAANATDPANADNAAPRIVQPGAPGQPSRVISVEQATDLSGVAHGEADVRFMQGMIHHHAQALQMTALVPNRSGSDTVRLLAQRIDLSQLDEIGMMQSWLRARGESVPTGDERGHDMMMPGMLTAAEMESLAAARGAEFDRLFLAGMIKHHGGALVMVDDLFAQPRAGQESTINAFATEVVADQRAEMDRMGAMLNAMREGS